MFLLVPAHPGFPGQIPQSRKTVVCVCVCVCVCYSTEKKKLKPKRVESLFHAAVSSLPDAELSSELLADAEKYLDYFRR